MRGMRHTMALWALLLCSSASVALGQTAGSGEMLDRLRGGGVLLNFAMLEQASVQRELQLTSQQIQSATALAQEQRSRLQGLSQLPRAEAAQKIAAARDASQQGLLKILSRPQYARLQEISLQQAGPLVGLTNPDVATSVGLNAMQQQQLRTIQEQLISQLTGLAQQPTGLGRGRALLDAVREAQAAKQQADARTMALLTADQQMRWQQVQGVPFQGEIQWGGMRGRFRNR
ncbi:hypothetical protein GC163_07085 [bacterium]|nr:hypothetical protein [bacterium]